jgi:hypothetical protein
MTRTGAPILQGNQVKREAAGGGVLTLLRFDRLPWARAPRPLRFAWGERTPMYESH